MKQLLTILFSVFSLNAIATDYYVSNTGSDAANGTSTGTAWQTISKVNSSSFSAGDHIYFKRGGVWREQLNIPSSGSAGNPITFGAYDAGAKPIINGADVKTGWTNAGSNQWWINNPNATTTRAMVVVGGVIYREEASLVAVDAANEYFIDVAASPDRVYVYSTVDPATLTAEVSARDYCIQTNASTLRHHIVIDNIEVRYAGRGGIYFEGPGGNESDAFDGANKVTNCTVYANRSFGVVHVDHSDNLTVEDCTATYNGNGFYSWQADEGTFRRCSTAHQIYYAISPNITDAHGFGGYQSDNWLVENNYSDDDADAIHLDAGGLGIDGTIRYNKVFNSQSAAPVPTPCMGVGSVGVGGVVSFYYNLLVNGSSAGFECYSQILGTVNFWNNTIYCSTDDAQTDAIYFTYGANFNVKNNLVTKDYVAFRRTFQILTVGSIPTMDYNCYYTFNNAEHFRHYYNGNHTTIGAWRTATSQDANAMNSDPLFVNVLSDWSLQAGSPCINDGVNVGLTQDIDGKQLTDTPDIGAYEFGASAVSVRGIIIVVQ